MQYLTQPDGSLPANIDADALIAAGIRLVRPMPCPPAAEGMVVVEGPPDFRDGLWWQTWQQQPAPAPAAPPVPHDVALWQFRAALKLAGQFDVVQNALGQLATPQALLAAELFEYGDRIERHSSLATEVMRLLGVTDEEADALFRQAVEIRP